LTALSPATGPERTLVTVTGSTLFASVVWDAGLPTETVIPGGWLGGYMFSVPPAAAPGAHPVAVRRNGADSASLDFVVTAPLPFGAPRVDRVSVVGATFSGGDVTSWLYVQGANTDVGAIVQIDGAAVATASHRGLVMERYDTDPAVLGYPVYHYLSLLADGGTRPAGSTVAVTITNLDGAVSTPVSFTLPASEATLDRDGDQLLDAWETAGYDADGDGVVDIDLPGLGTDPLRPDVLLEVDVMAGLDNPPIASAPGAPGTFETTQAMFAAAPVLNPGSDPGINLILDTSGSVAFAATISFGTIVPGPAGTTDFTTIRAANFAAARDNVYHYAVWANMIPGGYSGVSDIDFGGSGSGDDFIVSFDDFPASYQTLRSQVETLAHEFGHNLGQRHGGDTHSIYKPNYWSVMSYSWQLRSGQSNATRRSRTTCTPIYWADSTALEVNGAPPATPNAVVDYSHGMGPTVDEDSGTLDETVGVCGAAVYWNGDLDQTDTGLSLDADDNGVANETLSDFGNWRALNFGGPAADGDLP
jgi:hypothetical protein